MPLRGTCSQLGLVREHRSQPLKTTAALHVPSSTNTHNAHKYILLHVLCTEVKQSLQMSTRNATWLCQAVHVLSSLTAISIQS